MIDRGSRPGLMAHVVGTPCWSVGPEVGLDFSGYLFSLSCDVNCKCHQLTNTYTTHSPTMYFMADAIPNGLQHMSMTYQ